MLTKKLSTTSFHNMLNIIMASNVATIISLMFGLPFDTLKVRQQISNNFLDVLKKAHLQVRNNPTTLFKAYPATAATACVARAYGFTLYDQIKRSLPENIGKKYDSLIAGTLIGFTKPLFIAPTDWIKVQLQYEPHKSYKSLLHKFKQDPKEAYRAYPYLALKGVVGWSSWLQAEKFLELHYNNTLTNVQIGALSGGFSALMTLTPDLLSKLYQTGASAAPLTLLRNRCIFSIFSPIVIGLNVIKHTASSAVFKPINDYLKPQNGSPT